MHSRRGVCPGSNAAEIPLRAAYGPVYAKYSCALTDRFDRTNKKGSAHLDTGGDVAVTNGRSIHAHGGQ